jgi:hypothetical protein
MKYLTPRPQGLSIQKTALPLALFIPALDDGVSVLTDKTGSRYFLRKMEN